MGGFGSGRRWGTKKLTVEDCACLDARRWKRDGLLQAGIYGRGSCVWRDIQIGTITASLDYSVHTGDMKYPWVQLVYRRRRPKKEEVEYEIALQTTRPYFGGLRWWFTCPLITRGRACERRVGRLYLPPGARYYGCRHCYDLTYTSCQESHLYDRGFAQLAAGMPGTSGAEIRRLLRERYLYGTV
jgi:hypothetical protein